MDYHDPSKRFKSSNGAPMSIQSAAANLPAYQPPLPIGARRAARYVICISTSQLPFVCAESCVAEHVGREGKRKAAPARWIGIARDAGCWTEKEGAKHGNTESCVM